MPRDFYTDNPVSVRVRGGYHQTGVFLSRLANLNRIVNVDRVRMEALDQQGDGRLYTVATELSLTAYTLNGGGVPADGAAGRHSFRYITLPLLMPTMFVVLVLALIRAVQVFDQVFVLTGGGAGKNTTVLSQ